MSVIEQYNFYYLRTCKYCIFSSPEDMLIKEILFFSVSDKKDSYCVVTEMEGCRFNLIVYLKTFGYISWSFSFQVLDVFWVGSRICLMLENCFIIFDPILKKRMVLTLPSYRIHKIISLDSSEYIYSTFSKNINYCSIVKHDIIINKDTVIKEISSYEKEVKENIGNLNQDQQNAIDNFISTLSTYGQASFVGKINNAIIQFKYNRLNTEVVVEEKVRWTIPGFIQSGGIFKSKLIILWSNFLNEPQLVCLDEKQYDKFHFTNTSSISYRIDSSTLQPYYFVSDKKSKDYVLFLHGGPTGQFVNRYDFLYKCLLEINCNLLFLNYIGSSGYTSEYQSSLVNRGGKLDVKLIKEFIENFIKDYEIERLVVVGMSYGGYLSILLSKRFSTRGFIKFVSISGFCNVMFQYLFSPARNVIFLYLLNNYEKNKYSIDPVYMNFLDVKNLSFIHGLNDTYCPLEQIEQFCIKNNFKLSILKNLNHISMSLLEKLDVARILMKEMEND